MPVPRVLHFSALVLEAFPLLGFSVTEQEFTIRTYLLVFVKNDFTPQLEQRKY